MSDKNKSIKAKAKRVVVDTASGEIIEELLSISEPTTEDRKALQVLDTPKREAALSIVGGVTTEELKQALIVQTEQRKLIQDFIRDNLVEGVDYGRIHVVKSCVDEDRSRGSCKKDYHFSKSILFKPGQEKIFSLFGITDELEKDEMAYEMLGNMPGLIAYKCTMYRGDKRVGEGRGAATLGGTQNDPNSTIKKAEKRARMDACLSLGFSAYFTQDLDDPEYKAQRDMMNESARNKAEVIDKDEFGLMPRDPSLPIDDNERKVLFNMVLKAGIGRSDVIMALKANGIVDPTTIKSGQARMIMGMIKDNLFAVPASEPTIIPDSQDPDDIYKNPPPPAVLVEADLVVDEDLKRNIMVEFTRLHLNERGKVWFMRQSTGKPYASFEKFTDGDWTMAYDTITAIQNDNTLLDPMYVVAESEPIHEDELHE